MAEGGRFFDDYPVFWRKTGKVAYALYWVLENEEVHARASKLGVEKFYKRWNRCLTTMPKIISGENII